MWRSCCPPESGPVRPTCGTRRGRWSGWRPWRRRFRLLPYRSVGVDRGLLLAVRVDQVQVGEEDRGPMLAALSPTPVSDGGGYRALLGAD